MKYTKKNVAGLAVALLLSLIMGLNSCKKDEFFELKSAPVTEWKTVGDLELAIAYPYKNTFVNGESSIGIMAPFIRNLMSDIVRRIQDNAWQTGEVMLRQTDQRISNVESKYRPAYQTISACNYILDFLATNPFPDASTSDKNLNIDRIKGEALFLRAFSYYNLAQLFAPAYDPTGANDSKILVLRTKFTSDVNSALENTPTTTKAIYDQMAADFKVAADLLPKEWMTGMPNSYKFGRATKHAASFYYAKVLLHMGKYTEAITELNGVLNDPQKPRTLESNPLTLFTNDNTGTASGFNNPEVIFYAFYSDPLLNASNSRHPINIYYFFNKTFPNPFDFRSWWVASFDNQAMQRADIMVNGALTTSWLNDRRSQLYHLYRGNDVNQTLRGNANQIYLTEPLINPYVGVNDPVLLVNKYYRVGGTVGGALTHQNIPLIRSAEAYILRAAAKLQNGDVTGAASDLNVVRQRAWDTSTGGPFVQLTTATWNDVDKEWIRELAFESDRVAFLQMFRKPIASGMGRSGAATVSAPYDKLYWTIPLAETDFQR